jgi:hypothetical protein
MAPSREQIPGAHHLSCVHRVPQLVNFTKNSETNHTYSFHHTPLTYKILSSNLLYFSSNKKEIFDRFIPTNLSEIYLFYYFLLAMNLNLKFYM